MSSGWNVLGTKFGECDLTDAEVTWHRLRDAAALWSEEAFVSSCEDPQHRRFIFPAYLPGDWGFGVFLGLCLVSYQIILSATKSSK